MLKALPHLWKNFFYSLHGLRDTVRHEMAFRIELAVAIILMPATLKFHLSQIVQILLISSVFMILIFELLTT